MKLGTFYWCEPGQREKLEEQGIALNSISDIFLGRQTAELKAPIASAGATDLCFSITARQQGPAPEGGERQCPHGLPRRHPPRLD